MEKLLNRGQRWQRLQSASRSLDTATSNLHATPLLGLSQQELRVRLRRLKRFNQLLESPIYTSTSDVYRAYRDALDVPGGLSYLRPVHLRTTRARLREYPDKHTHTRVLHVLDMHKRLFGLSRQDWREYLYTLVRREDYGAVRRGFARMLGDGVKADTNAWNARIYAEAMTGVWRIATVIGEMRRSGVSRDANTYANAVEASVHVNVQTAQRWTTECMRDAVHGPVVGYVRMLRCLSHNGLGRDAVRLADWLAERGIGVDGWTRKAVAEVRVQWLIQQRDTAALWQLYQQHGKGMHAAFVAAFAALNQPKRMASAWDAMLAAGEMPLPLTAQRALLAYARTGDVGGMRRIMRTVEQLDLPLSYFVLKAWIREEMKRGVDKEAVAVALLAQNKMAAFREMLPAVQTSSLVCNAWLMHLIHAGRVEDARRLVRVMGDTGVHVHDALVERVQ